MQVEYYAECEAEIDSVIFVDFGRLGPGFAVRHAIFAGTWMAVQIPAAMWVVAKATM
jgi:hypothetical protein